MCPSNVETLSRIATLSHAKEILTKFEVDTATHYRVITLLVLMNYIVTLTFDLLNF